MIRPTSLLWRLLLSPMLLLAVMVGAQIKIPPSVIVWSDSRKLTWQDFQMASPKERDKDANTHTEIHHKDRWLCPSGELHSTVVAWFDPKESWVIDTMKGDGRLLEHEQIHFDLAEVYARILRKQLSGFKVQCGHKEDVIRTQIDVIANKIIKDWQIEQDRYDVETKNSLDEKAQTEWAKKVKAMLQVISPH